MTIKITKYIQYIQTQKSEKKVLAAGIITKINMKTTMRLTSIRASNHPSPPPPPPTLLR
jgi:hypothetical protein